MQTVTWYVIQQPRDANETDTLSMQVIDSWNGPDDWDLAYKTLNSRSEKYARPCKISLAQNNGQLHHRIAL